MVIIRLLLLPQQLQPLVGERVNFQAEAEMEVRGEAIPETLQPLLEQVFLVKVEMVERLLIVEVAEAEEQVKLDKLLQTQTAVGLEAMGLLTYYALVQTKLEQVEAERGQEILREQQRLAARAEAERAEWRVPLPHREL
jgi:hypothetical protein